MANVNLTPQDSEVVRPKISMIEKLKVNSKLNFLNSYGGLLCCVEIPNPCDGVIKVLNMVRSLERALRRVKIPMESSMESDWVNRC